MSIIHIFEEQPQKNNNHLFAYLYLGIAVAMLVSWISGFLDHATDGVAVTAFMLTAWLACLFAFFVLTGFEVAYTDLRDKDPHTVGTLRKLLESMQDDETRLYEAKEWCAVLVTVAFALIAERHFHLHAELLPKEWRSQVESLRLPFVLAFTTVPILWLAQGPAKKYAIRNSESFLTRYGKVTWIVVRGVGSLIDRLRLPAPSDLIVDLMGLGPKRNLPPSLSAYYMTSMKLAGHAYYLIDEKIRIHKDGNSTISTRWIACAIDSVVESGLRATLRVDTELVDCKQGVVNSAFQIPVPGEQFKDFDMQMAKIAATQPEQEHDRFWIDYIEEDDPARAKKTLHTIRITPNAAMKDGNALVVDYETRFELKKGVYELPKDDAECDDFHQRTFDWPTRRYSLEISFDEEIKGVFTSVEAEVLFGGAPHHAEEKRVRDSFKQDLGIRLEVEFPRAGGAYKVRWKVSSRA